MRISLTTLLLMMMCNFTFAQYSEIWGAAYLGGANDNGFIFKMDYNADNYEVMYEFVGHEMGENPYGVLSEGADGKIYGITGKGGSNSKGIIFSFDPEYNSFNVEFHLVSRVGRSLTLGPDGRFYTISIDNFGQLVAYDPVEKSFETVYDFPSSEGTSLFADEQLQIINDSLIYGTLSTGAGGQGVLFEYNLNQNAYTVLHKFENDEGEKPYSSFVVYGDKIYGTTQYGGSSNRGVLYEYDLSTNIYSVKQNLLGLHYYAEGMCLADDGNIYINVSIGGSEGGGGVYKFDPVNNIIDFVIEFENEGPAYLPTGSLMETYNGKLLGATRYGGSGGGLGIVYEYDYNTGVNTTKQNLNDGFPLNTILLEVGERTVSEVNVTAPAVEITVDNGTLQMEYSLLPIEAEGQAVVWSVSDPALASINEAGVLTAINNGSVYVKATSNYGLGVADSTLITLSNQDGISEDILVETLRIASPTNQITSFESALQLDINHSPSNATNASVTWHTSDNGVATVSSTGLVTPVAAGMVTITALAQDGSNVFAKIDLNITNLITSMILTPNTTVIDEPFGSIDFDVQIFPADATNQEVTWSTTHLNTLVSIDENGVLTALKNTLGYVTVTVETNDGSGIALTRNIQISNQESNIEVTGVTLASETASTEINEEGGTLQVVATISPANASYKTLTWTSSDTSVATVDENGLVTAKANGATTIVAKSINGKLGLLPITVSEQPGGPYALESITFDQNVYTIDVKGGIYQLAPIFGPANHTDDTTDLTLTISGTNVSTDENLLVTALGDGDTYLRVHTRNLFNEYVESNLIIISVSNQTDPDVLLTSLAIEAPNDSILEKDGSMQLSTVVTPSNATNSSVTWSIDNETIASISSNGLLTAKDNGLVMVTATANDASGLSAQTQIRLVNQEDLIDVGVILLASEQDTLEQIGDEVQLTATVLPLNASNQTIRWSVNDETIASISEDGLLTALAYGTVVITATTTDGTGISASMTIQVTEPLLTYLSDEVKEVELAIYPNPASDKLHIKSDREIILAEIYSLEGLQLLSFKNTEIEISSLSAGLYIIKVLSASNEVYNITFIKN